MSVAHWLNFATAEFWGRLKVPQPRAGGAYEHTHLPKIGDRHRPTPARTLHYQVYPTDHACPDVAPHRFGLVGTSVLAMGRPALAASTAPGDPTGTTDRVCRPDLLVDGGDPTAVAEIGRRHHPLAVRSSPTWPSPWAIRSIQSWARCGSSTRPTMGVARSALDCCRSSWPSS
jgi:hypothetical protein